MRVNQTCLSRKGATRTTRCTRHTGSIGDGYTMTCLLDNSITLGLGSIGGTDDSCGRTVCLSRGYDRTCFGCTRMCGNMSPRLSLSVLVHLRAGTPSSGHVDGRLTSMCCAVKRCNGTGRTCRDCLGMNAPARRSCAHCTVLLCLGGSCTRSSSVMGGNLRLTPRGRILGHLTVCSGLRLGSCGRKLRTTTAFFSGPNGPSCMCLSCICFTHLLRTSGRCSRTITRFSGTLTVSGSRARVCGSVSSMCRGRHSFPGTVRTCGGCLNKVGNSPSVDSLFLCKHLGCCTTASSTCRSGRPLCLTRTSAVFTRITTGIPSGCLKGF